MMSLRQNRVYNNCIFQAVSYSNSSLCADPVLHCSKDASNDDGTFICNHHLSMYFPLEKMTLEIPSGTGTSFKLLIGKSLVQQDATRNIIIPSKANYIDYLRVNNMSPAEKFIMYSIYGESATEPTGLITQLCESLRSQDFYTDDMLSDLYSVVAEIMSKINPAIYCRPILNNSSRSFGKTSLTDTELQNIVTSSTVDANDYDTTQDRAYRAMPPFIKNLILRLVRPVTLIVSSNRHNDKFILNNADTCDLIEDKGLTAANLYNFEKPRHRLMHEKKFDIQHLTQFKGRAAEQQRHLSTYPVYKIARPLMLGIEIIVTPQF
uniref:PlxyGVORF79 protein n=1 Tax=Plutella xylostella granulovirus TaxID=98383 RepID=A0A1B2CSJ2_9BBAC|nr:PlxyGVORF79 protein [Plutella xylostella granulovirus]